MDDAAYAELYDAQAERLLVFFARRTLDPEVALDLWAETLAAAFIARRRCRARDAAGRASWLYGIAHRRLALLARRGVAERRSLERLRLERPVASQDELDRLEELAGLRRLRAQVADAVEHLPGAQRDAIRLRVVEELAYPEVARRLSVSEPAARARVSRALRSLRLTLHAEEARP
jgi:RNA polymerase sigma-70 factor, ECF subfamily